MGGGGWSAGQRGELLGGEGFEFEQAAGWQEAVQVGDVFEGWSGFVGGVGVWVHDVWILDGGLKGLFVFRVPCSVFRVPCSVWRAVFCGKRKTENGKRAHCFGL